ncbi:MAG: hypothetical protein HYW78_03860 [Parcubacteria group bacterium]|nr:hypothetical protein [Parcubacteria group bacterium]
MDIKWSSNSVRIFILFLLFFLWRSVGAEVSYSFSDSFSGDAWLSRASSTALIDNETQTIAVPPRFETFDLSDQLARIITAGESPRIIAGNESMILFNTDTGRVFFFDRSLQDFFPIDDIKMQLTRGAFFRNTFLVEASGGGELKNRFYKLAVDANEKKLFRFIDISDIVYESLDTVVSWNCAQTFCLFAGMKNNALTFIHYNGASIEAMYTFQENGNRSVRSITVGEGRDVVIVGAMVSDSKDVWGELYLWDGNSLQRIIKDKELFISRYPSYERIPYFNFIYDRDRGQWFILSLGYEGKIAVLAPNKKLRIIDTLPIKLTKGGFVGSTARSAASFYVASKDLLLMITQEGIALVVKPFLETIRYMSDITLFGDGNSGIYIAGSVPLQYGGPKFFLINDLGFAPGIFSIVSANLSQYNKYIPVASLYGVRGESIENGVRFFLSQNGGASWEKARNDEEHIFETIDGRDMRWMALLQSASRFHTPSLRFVGVRWQGTDTIEEARALQESRKKEIAPRAFSKFTESNNGILFIIGIVVGALVLLFVISYIFRKRKNG